MMKLGLLVVSFSSAILVSATLILYEPPQSFSARYASYGCNEVGPFDPIFPNCCLPLLIASTVPAQCTSLLSNTCSCTTQWITNAAPFTMSGTLSCPLPSTSSSPSAPRTTLSLSLSTTTPVPTSTFTIVPPPVTTLGIQLAFASSTTTSTSSSYEVPMIPDHAADGGVW